MTETTTYPSNPRLLYLDFLRGIAVLGLLTMNISTMGLFSPETVMSAELISDKWIRALQALLLDGRFRSIFCLLFGIGLYLQFTRYQQLNLQPKAFKLVISVWRIPLPFSVVWRCITYLCIIWVGSHKTASRYTRTNIQAWLLLFFNCYSNTNSSIYSYLFYRIRVLHYC